MLKNRILLTLSFFDAQGTPLTISELGNFLLNDFEALANAVNENFEILAAISIGEKITEEKIESVIEQELAQEVEKFGNYYCLRGKRDLVNQSAGSAPYKLNREKIIKRFVPMLKFIPFVRGVAIGGSQTLGAAKKESDIDVLIITDQNFLWLARLLVTGYFQLTGRRRHGKKIMDRFCLNHYLAGFQQVRSERDLYNAMEYLRLRPEIYPQNIAEFVNLNIGWIQKFFPNATTRSFVQQKQPKFQLWLEKVFLNKFGLWLNRRLGIWQLKRINRGEHAVADEKELSFHSKSRKFTFLSKFFEDQKQKNRLLQSSG